MDRAYVVVSHIRKYRYPKSMLNRSSYLQHASNLASKDLRELLHLDDLSHLNFEIDIEEELPYKVDNSPEAAMKRKKMRKNALNYAITLDALVDQAMVKKYKSEIDPTIAQHLFVERKNFNDESVYDLKPEILRERERLYDYYDSILNKVSSVCL